MTLAPKNPDGIATSANTGDVVLATFPRKANERLVVSWREYNGHHFADVRVHFRADDGEWRPTKSGATVKIAELFNFADAIERACELAKAVDR